MDYDRLEGLLAKRRALVQDLSTVEAQIAGAVNGKATTKPAIAPVANDEDLTRDQAAALIGVSVATMHNWATNGKGPKFRKRGRTSIYKAAAVEAFKKTYVPNARV